MHSNPAQQDILTHQDGLRAKLVGDMKRIEFEVCQVEILMEQLKIQKQLPAFKSGDKSIKKSQKSLEDIIASLKTSGDKTRHRVSEVDQTDLLREEAKHAVSQRRYSDAIQKYEQALTFSSGITNEFRATVLTNMSICLFNLGQYQTCIIRCNEALSYRPYNCKALYRRAIAHERLGRFNEALRDIYSKHVIQSSSSGVRPEEDTILALRRLKKLVRIQSFPISERIGQFMNLLRATQNANEKLSYLTHLIHLSSSTDPCPLSNEDLLAIYWEYVITSKSLDQLDNALAMAKEFAHRFPNSFLSHETLGDVYLTLQSYRDAHASYENAIKVVNADPNIRQRLERKCADASRAEKLMATKEIEQKCRELLRREKFKECMKLCQATEEQLMSLRHESLAMSQQSVSATQEAETEAAFILECDKGISNLLRMQGEINYNQKRYTDAFNLCDNSLKLYAYNSEAYIVKARAAWANQDVEGALRICFEGLKFDKENVTLKSLADDTMKAFRAEKEKLSQQQLSPAATRRR
eukprot:TRINITY_DN12440_c0_g1::TRINITY_DN12440_c0_g1_i1::g.15086::m.15086 TRINITY_DN12440_c0_g1::TRINITY_DN12440_c0_g1_i1::g.15086  ORF type:complete len:553 (+),score=54.13,sp/Q07617/SPAG1_HUMAN/31.03/1e-09,TPR_11/PF13414.1/5.4e-05,TPR_11/PF13414.1/8.7e-08,TPR_11/PF13414.1/0.078,TPR_11/PF13414.1/0.015,TPR_2/PF07719.12/0.84,TPR_2/PF07719.12/0.32,TPR_2/PF07719.12/0.0088,TPR_2/PF07719.12/0.25,TPR_2/PF07719.12/1,TPR_2/PF07719.12/3.4e+02,TPR_12/PF13424.1/0.00024,TPR_12/PF13424.1/8.5,TPR_12/PF13424.1/0.035,T